MRYRNSLRAGRLVPGLVVLTIGGAALALAAGVGPVPAVAVDHDSTAVVASESSDPRGASPARQSAALDVSELRILKAGRLIGMAVRNPDGDTLGRIEELVIDRRSGEIAYAVLAHGAGFFGASKYFAIPWEGLELRATDGVLVLDVDLQRLESAEGMQWQGDWPLEPDPMFADVVRRSRSEAANGDDPGADDRYEGEPGSTAGSSVVVPAETSIDVELDDRLGSDDSVVGEQFTMTVVSPVRVAGELAIPHGTEIVGTVAAVQEAERPDKPGMLELEPELLVLGGREVSLRARITIEGEEVEGDRSIEEDLREIGIGAAVGAVLGGIIKGGKGALAGLIIGGTGTFLATKGEQVELPAGTPLIVELQRDLEVPVTTDF